MGSEVQGFISVPGLHLERVFSKRSQVLHMCVLRATSYSLYAGCTERVQMRCL